MRGVTARFVLLIASAAVAPLLLYGVVSIVQLKSGTEQSVAEGNSRVATQAAGQISQYITNNARVLRSLGVQLQKGPFSEASRARMLRDYVSDFQEFREISMLDASGAVVATSRYGAPRIVLPAAAAASKDGIYVAPLRVDDDFLPTTTIAVRTTTTAGAGPWIAGELALEELWRMVDGIRVGTQGYAFLLSETGTLVAHGNPRKKREIAEGAKANRAAGATPAEPPTDEEMLSRDATVPGVNWKVGVEQPKAEAFLLASQLARQLGFVIAAALLGTIVVGYFWARTFIVRIHALRRAALAIGQGRLGERVAMSGQDELKQLGDSFNSMADNIVQLQEDVRKQERQAMFGRIAAGLVHDLSHPIQNIGNSCKLIQKMYDDLEYRETFKRTVEREMVVIKRVLEDLRNIARPIPLERFPIEVDRSVADVVESMQQLAETAGLTLRAELGAPATFIDADLFALGRVYRNLIVNAIQATAPGGVVIVSTVPLTERVQIRVSDTGCGIPADRLKQVFEDFVTTKRRGLGLGLAIARKIVEQLGGRIAVVSEVGKGTTFTLEFNGTRAEALRGV